MSDCPFDYRHPSIEDIPVVISEYAPPDKKVVVQSFDPPRGVVLTLGDGLPVMPSPESVLKVDVPPETTGGFTDLKLKPSAVPTEEDIANMVAAVSVCPEDDGLLA